MSSISEEVIIARTPPEVWRVLADFGGISAWAENVDHSCLTTTETHGAGMQRRVQVGRNTVLERVEQWEPERRLGYSIEGLPPIIRSVTNVWHLADTGGSTKVKLVSTVDTGNRPPQRVAAQVVGRMLAKASRQMLDGLKHHVEQDDQ